MRNIFFISIIFFTCTILYGQDVGTCEEKANNIEDLNIINYNKCLIEKSSTKNKDKAVIAHRLEEQLKLRITSKNKLKLRRYSTGKKHNVKNAIETEKIVRKIKTTYIPNEILFTLVDELPRFENCNSNSVRCFNRELRTHFMESFTYPEEAIKNRVEGRVFVRFVINKEGNIGDIKTFCSGNKKILEDEIRRIVLTLPKFTAGKELGQNIDVVYSMPIDFKL